MVAAITRQQERKPELSMRKRLWLKCFVHLCLIRWFNAATEMRALNALKKILLSKHVIPLLVIS